MKRTLFISVSILLSLCWSVAAWAQTQIHTVASTEGYEFFGAFLPNGSSYANTPDLKLQLVFSCREMPGVTQNNVTIQLYEGNNLRTRTVQVPVPGTTTYTFSTADAARVYWVNNKGKTDEETVVNKGFRIYSTNNVPMTVYAVNQIGDKAGTYSFDGAHLLPRQVLGYEYLAACHADEAISTEFVVMSTRTGETNVTVTLPDKVSTYTGKTGTVTIKFTKPYQTYIIRSKEGADLSGTQICADKPIAVWSGNQAAQIPLNDMAGSVDHTFDQMLPINRWGKKFFVPLTVMNTRLNDIKIVAKEASTSVKVYHDGKTDSYTLGVGGSKQVRLGTASSLTTELDKSTAIIDATKPIEVYLYTSSAIANPSQADGDILTYISDPSMTLIAPLETLADTMVFTTYSKPTIQNDKPLKHQLVVWATKGSEVKLNGTKITGFKDGPSNAPAALKNYQYARVDINAGTYTLTAAKKCFGGYIYGLEDGQAYLYPVGYNFLPDKDSIFLEDKTKLYEGDVTSKFYHDKLKAWHMGRIELPNKPAQLDYVYICSKEGKEIKLRFPINIHNMEWDKIEWSITRSYPVKSGNKTTIKQEEYTDDVSKNERTTKGLEPANAPKPSLETVFHLKEDIRSQYEDFEVRAILYNKTSCAIDDKMETWQQDTLNAMVRIFRFFADTTWMVKCDNAAAFTFFGTNGKYTTFYTPKTSGTANGDTKIRIDQSGDYKLTRSYQTTKGCDSIVTLKVYVCDTYKKEETYVVCETGLPDLQKQLGDFFTNDRENKNVNFATTLEQSKAGNSTLWKYQSSGTYKGMWYYTGTSKLWSKGCYDPEYAANGQVFNGCDSIMTVKIYAKPVEVRPYGPFTYCEENYTWSDKDGKRLQIITRNNLGIEKTYENHVKYKRSGWTECDSILHVLKLRFIKQDHEVTKEKYLCKDDGLVTVYDKIEGNEYSWEINTDTATLGKWLLGPQEDFYNADNCPYAFRYKVWVNPIKTNPTDTVVYCYEKGRKNIPYTWEGHSKFWWNKKGDTEVKRVSSLTLSIPATHAVGEPDTRDIYELADTLELASGCHDIYRRVVIVMPEYNMSETQPSITSEQSFKWAGNTWAGENANVSGAFKLDPNGATYADPKTKDGWTVEYNAKTWAYTIKGTMLTKAISGTSCDSAVSLSVAVGKIYRDTTFAYACGEDEGYVWEGHENVEIGKLPKVDAPKQICFSDSFLTKGLAPGLDSIEVLNLTVYPSHYILSEDKACQNDAPYVWTKHMGEGHEIWINGDSIGEITSIRTDTFGVFRIEDKLRTKPQKFVDPSSGAEFDVQCDSSEVLTLTIHKIYNETLNRVEYQRTMQTKDTMTFFTNPKKLYLGENFDFTAHGVTRAAFEAQFGAGNIIDISTTKDLDEFKDSQYSKSKAGGCDSTTYLTLSILKTKHETQVEHFGDNDATWTFGGNETDANGNPIHSQSLITSEYLRSHYPDGNTRTVDQSEGREDTEVYTFTFVDTVKTALGADSIVTATITVYPTYRIFDSSATTCSVLDKDEYPDGYVWRGHKYLNRLIPTDLVTGIVEVHDSLCVDKYCDLNGITRGARIDSIRVLKLKIIPNETQMLVHPQCKNETYTWGPYVISYDPNLQTLSKGRAYTDEYDCRHVDSLFVVWKDTYGLDDDEDFVDNIRTCQDPSRPFRWLDKNGKEHNKNLYDEDGNKITSIPQDKKGTFTYYDSLKTKECKCDSVYTLVLTVGSAFQQFDYDLHPSVCLGRDKFVDWPVNIDIKKIYPIVSPGDFYDTIKGTAASGCDSSYYFYYHVDSTYIIRDTVNLCADAGHFEWHGNVYDELLEESRTWTEPKTIGDSIIGKTAICKCDSNYYLVLTIGPSPDSLFTDTICKGETYDFYGKQLKSSGEYEDIHPNQYGCPTKYILTLHVIPPTQVKVEQEPVCVNESGVNNTYTLLYSFDEGYPPLTFTLGYDSLATAMGFDSIIDRKITATADENGKYRLYLPVPDFKEKESYPVPGIYDATISFKNGMCESDDLMNYPFKFVINYPSWLIEQQDNNVIALLSENYNGGYSWTKYQWYHGDTLLLGQTEPYLHLPAGLVEGDEYSVRLTREGEDVSIATCPITIVSNPYNKFAPTMGYLSVVPTHIPVADPRVNILSHSPDGDVSGRYRITTPGGQLVSEGEFHSDVTEVNLRSINAGVYVFQLWSDDTPEEPYRAIKVIVM